MANVYNKPIVVIGGGESELPVDNGPIYENKFRVRYFDIDGTVLKIEYVAEGGVLNPPLNPNYDPDYLIFDEWNYDIENYVVEQPTDVGATYKTVDDATYMFCRFTNATGLNPTLKINSFTSIDWGDGTIDTNVSHTYSKEGNYLIKINGNFNITDTIINLYNVVIKAYIKKGISSTTSYIFRRQSSLIVVSIPKNFERITKGMFENCVKLKCFVLPKGIERFLGYAFDFCSSLKNIVFAEDTTSELMSDYFIYQTTPLESVIFPPSINKIEYQVFSIQTLKDVVISKNIIEINNSFKTCSINNVFVLTNNIPTLTSSFTINSGEVFKTNNTIFWIKDDIIEDLKVATNWSTYASQMKPLSWYPSLTDPNAERILHDQP